MDEDDFEVLRRKRLEKLKRQEQQKAEWRLLGHGVCVLDETSACTTDVGQADAPSPISLKPTLPQSPNPTHSYSELPNQQAFFEAAKKSPRMVVHFYRPTTRYCQVVDAHFERLAARHLETRVR